MSAASNATGPSPEVPKTWRERSRLLAPGRDAHLPGETQPVVLRARVSMPDTVAGPHRHVTGFRGSARDELFSKLTHA
jgi:hypothetical protein